MKICKKKKMSLRNLWQTWQDSTNIQNYSEMVPLASVRGKKPFSSLWTSGAVAHIKWKKRVMANEIQWIQTFEMMHASLKKVKSMFTLWVWFYLLYRQKYVRKILITRTSVTSTSVRNYDLYLERISHEKCAYEA